MNKAIWQQRHEVPYIGISVAEPVVTTHSTSVVGGPRRSVPQVKMTEYDEWM